MTISTTTVTASIPMGRRRGITTRTGTGSSRSRKRWCWGCHLLYIPICRMNILRRHQRSGGSGKRRRRRGIGWSDDEYGTQGTQCTHPTIITRDFPGRGGGPR